jgi:hypothetical protein
MKSHTEHLNAHFPLQEERINNKKQRVKSRIMSQWKANTV